MLPLMSDFTGMKAVDPRTSGVKSIGEKYAMQQQKLLANQRKGRFRCRRAERTVLGCRPPPTQVGTDVLPGKTKSLR